MNEERDPKTTAWIEAALQHAQYGVANLDTYKSEDVADYDIYSFDSKSFWLALPEPPFRENYNADSTRQFLFFNKHSIAEEKLLLIQYQFEARADLDLEILNIDAEPVKRLKKIEAARSLPNKSGSPYYWRSTEETVNLYPKTLLAYILSRRDFFRQNKILTFACDFLPIVNELLEKYPFIDQLRDLSSFAADYLRKNTGFDVTANQLTSFMTLLLSEDEHTALAKFLEQKRAIAKANGRKLMPLKVQHPDGIVEANNIHEGVSSIFSGAQRPRRGDRREAGGRAGLGKAKPDLWHSPENE